MRLLKEKLNAALQSMARLQKTKVTLENDIAIKESSIDIDRRECIGLRKTVAIDPTRGGANFSMTLTGFWVSAGPYATSSRPVATYTISICEKSPHWWSVFLCKLSTGFVTVRYVPLSFSFFIHSTIPIPTNLSSAVLGYKVGPACTFQVLTACSCLLTRLTILPFNIAYCASFVNTS